MTKTRFDKLRENWDEFNMHVMQVIPALILAWPIVSFVALFGQFVDMGFESSQVYAGTMEFRTQYLEDSITMGDILVTIFFLPWLIFAGVCNLLVAISYNIWEFVCPFYESILGFEIIGGEEG